MATAEQVKQLREQTGAGIMECKTALLEAGGELEKAIEILRKQGVVKAAKKAARATKEGRVACRVSDDGQRAAVVELACETDFVARTDDFKDFVAKLADHIVSRNPSDVPALLAEKLLSDSGQTVEEALKALIAKIGENLSVTRFAVLDCSGDNQKIAQYVHAGDQIGVIVKVQGAGVESNAVRDVAMHVAAMQPLYIAPMNVPDEVATKEKEVLRASPDLSGKPEGVADKIIEGRYRKFLEQVCLTEQVFIKDSSGKQTVRQFLHSLDAAAEVLSFIRYQVGDSAPSESEE